VLVPVVEADHGRLLWVCWSDWKLIPTVMQMSLAASLDGNEGTFLDRKHPKTQSSLWDIPGPKTSDNSELSMHTMPLLNQSFT
jgi:hypothetical protein